jgi:hypothetical protein
MDKLNSEAIAELDTWTAESLKKLNAQTPAQSLEDWAAGMESGQDLSAEERDIEKTALHDFIVEYVQDHLNRNTSTK